MNWKSQWGWRIAGVRVLKSEVKGCRWYEAEIVGGLQSLVPEHKTEQAR